MGKSADAPLVDPARGGFINIHNWRGRVWNKAVAAAGLGVRDLTPKALRHTAASMAIAAGADVKVVQRMLGHADAPARSRAAALAAAVVFVVLIVVFVFIVIVTPSLRGSRINHIWCE